MRTIEKADGQVLGAFGSLDDLEAALRAAGARPRYSPQLLRPPRLAPRGEGGPSTSPSTSPTASPGRGPGALPFPGRGGGEGRPHHLGPGGRPGRGASPKSGRGSTSRDRTLGVSGARSSSRACPRRGWSSTGRPWPILRKRVWEMLREESPWGSPARRPPEGLRLHQPLRVVLEGKRRGSPGGGGGLGPDLQQGLRQGVPRGRGRAGLPPPGEAEGGDPLPSRGQTPREEAEERLEAAARGLRSARKEPGVRG